MESTCLESKIGTRNAAIKLLLALALAVLTGATAQAQSRAKTQPAPDNTGLPEPPAQTSLPDLPNSRIVSTPIVIDPEYPHSFRYKSGERFFPMGDTAYALLGGPKDVITRYIDVRRAHKFNFIRIMAAANGNWPFGGTPERPDYAVINEPAMQKLGWLFDYAAI